MRRTVAVGIAGLVAVEAAGQCDRWPAGLGVPDGLNALVNTVLTCRNPDGTADVIVGGDFTVAGETAARRIARWGQAGWEPLGDGMNGSVRALASWDPDGAGPQPTRLVAGGSFTTAGATTAAAVAWWDGSEWHALGDGFGAMVQALTEWDPDGAGPMEARLIAGGSFQTSGAVSVRRIAMWNGTSWEALGTGFDSAVRALTSWDPDGPGPADPLLIAGGDFNPAGGPKRIAAWNGAAWNKLASGVDGSVRTLSTWDSDGPGPATALLVAGGVFEPSPAINIAVWNGEAWAALGDGLSGTVSATLSIPSPDAGPDRLVAVGSFLGSGPRSVIRAAEWDGAMWQQLGAGLNSTVTAAAAWDPDDAGPAGDVIIAVGSFTSSGSGVDATVLQRVGAFNGERWTTLGSPLNGQVNALTSWDPDGAGGERPKLIAGGLFGSGSGVPARHIAAWDGMSWDQVGGGVSIPSPSPVQSLGTWDPDGSGPARRELIVGGKFEKAGEITVNGIAGWDGARWREFGAGFMHSSGTVTDQNVILTWNEQPAGEGPDEMVVGGWMTTIDGVTFNGIARWNGASWVPMGANFSAAVRGLVRWDPDGPGPAAPEFIAAGAFHTSGPAIVNFVSRWDGTQWRAMHTGLGAEANAITLWDPDGPGPLNKRVVVGGAFTSASGLPRNHVAWWDGSRWQALGTGLDEEVFTLGTWDPDGPGPEIERLVAGGTFFDAGTQAVNFIAWWDGAVWHPMQGGTDHVVRALTAFDVDGDGPSPDMLVAGGQFEAAGGTPAYFVAGWIADVPPVLIEQPSPASLCAGSNLELTVRATGVGPLLYQWRRGGVLLTDGAAPGGSVVSGSGTPTLRVAGTTGDDGGLYDCMVTGGCGTIVSDAAEVDVASCCAADLNGDGEVDFADYLEFLNLYDTQDPRADFNQDGFVDFGDYLEFLNHYDAGC